MVPTAMRSGGTDAIRWRDHAVSDGLSGEHTLAVKPIGDVLVEIALVSPAM